MKYLNVLVVCIVAFVFVFNIFPSKTYACSCMEPGSPSEEMARKSAVFSGKVIDIKSDTAYKAFNETPPVSVLIEVKDIWKGIDESQVIVYTDWDSASCGFHFEINEEYMIYANETDDQLRVSLCSRSALLADAADDLAELGEGQKPSKVVELSLNKDGAKHKVFFTTGLVVIVIVATGLFIYKRRK